MKTMMKFKVPIQERFELAMPLGARILSMQLQAGRPCLWALADPEAEARVRCFYFAFNGEPIAPPAEALEFIGTAQLADTGLGEGVWHLFELPGLEHAPAP